MLNQDLFLKNLKENTSKRSARLNEEELFSLLDRLNQTNVDFRQIESEISIFDFFRESVLQTFNLINELKIDENIDNSMKNELEQVNRNFSQQLHGFQNYLMSGESLELIDGEHLRIHDVELTLLMKDFFEELKRLANDKAINLFVISQIGKQSVGKSFLLNHVFKTKFLNKSGRCTSGINLAVRDLDFERREKKDVKNNDKLLILDTEGLGSLDKGNRMTSKQLNFDRLMVLFCLTVSNAMIVTLKGEID